MSRPVNKMELLAAAEKEYQALEKDLAGISSQQMATRTTSGGWAVKDILAHLYAWQQMVFTWYEEGRCGEKPAVPAPGYKWSQLPALNAAIYERYQDLPPERALELFRDSHQKTLRFIENISDNDLVSPGLYPWMNQNTLLAYLHSAADAHYAWARKEIKKALRGELVK